jgi:DNA topoisomerase-1
MTAPEHDKDKNPYVIRYNKAEDVHYLASEKNGKKTKWMAIYNHGIWEQKHKDNT